jgi:hypothetical protein
MSEPPRRREKRERRPSNLPVVLIVIAVFIVGLGGIGLFMFHEMNPSSTLFGPRIGEGETRHPGAISGNYQMACTLRSGQGQDMSLTFNTENACADLATPYERTADGYVRLMFNPVTGTFTRQTISADLQSVHRELYSPSRSDFNRISQISGGNALACTQPGDLPALEALQTQLRAQRTGASELMSSPAAMVSWRCTPTSTPAQPLPNASPPVENTATPPPTVNAAAPPQEEPQTPPREEPSPPQEEPQTEPPQQPDVTTPPQEEPPQQEEPTQQTPADDQAPSDDKGPGTTSGDDQ